MFDSPKEKAEKAKALKKLVAKWLSVQATARKASVLLTKNPELKVAGPSKNRKDHGGNISPF